MLPLALTMGEPAGVGGDVTLKAWAERAHLNLPPFVCIDDPDRLTALAHRLGLDLPVQVVETMSAGTAAFDHALPVLVEKVPHPVEPGQADPRNTTAVMTSIERAVALTQAGEASGVVTNPISKSVLQAGGFSFPGHTEFLADLAGGVEPVMMLACSELRVVPVTIHVSILDAVEMLTVDLIVSCGRITAAALKQSFGISHPRLAVAGLNPHAGEDGAMGREDMDIVAPAVETLRAEGIDAFGPLPSDTMFHPAARAGYDVALCMYHDQALIPIKTVDFASGVNVTLGLPFVRTSPDHGTAFNIAGSGQADESSLVAALRMAADMAERQA